MQLLIKNGSVYAPQRLGKKDLLCAGGKIIAIEDEINESALVGEYQVIDAKGANVVPGFVDSLKGKRVSRHRKASDRKFRRTEWQLVGVPPGRQPKHRSRLWALRLRMGWPVSL